VGAQQVTDRWWWRWLLGPLRLGLQAGGATVALMGVMALVARLFGLGASTVLAVTTPGSLAFTVLAVKRGAPNPPLGFAPTMARFVVAACLGLSLASLSLLGVTLGLGAALRTPSAALSLIGLGLVASVAGRFPRIPAESPLVTAREWAHADDATVVGALLLMTVALTLHADPVRQLLVLQEALNGVSVAGRLCLVSLAALVPLGTVAVLAGTRRGRSPVARGLVVATLAPVLGVALGWWLGAATDNPSTTLVAEGMTLAATAWRRSHAIWAASFVLGSGCAALVALTAGLRARAHGVVHDDQDRRMGVLLAPLATAAIVVLVAALLAARLGAGALPELGLGVGVVAMTAIASVHLGAAALGGIASTMRRRAAGYVASATIAGLIAVLFGAVGASLWRGLEAKPLAPMAWPQLVAQVAVAQKVVLALGLSFAAPVLVSAGLTVRERGGMASALTAGRHVAWATLLASLAVVGLATTAPTRRADISRPLDELMARVSQLPRVGPGAPCLGLDTARMLSLGRRELHWGGEKVAATVALVDDDACAAAVETVDPELTVTLTVHAATTADQLGCVLRGLSRRGACRLRIVGVATDSVLPRCQEGQIVGAGCGGPVPIELLRMGTKSVQIDHGPVAARLRDGRFPDDAHLWAELGESSVALWVEPSVAAGDAVWMWHELGRRAGELLYVLPASGADSGPAGAAWSAAAIAATAADERVGASAERALSHRMRELAACQHGGASRSYRVALRWDGHVAGVVPAEGASWSEAACTGRVLEGMVVGLSDEATMAVVSLFRRDE
jgi:hypothetical protein